MTDVIDEIRDERQRQQCVEGWSEEHDDQHDAGELAAAGSAYAFVAALPDYDAAQWPAGDPPEDWPFEAGAWKPKDRRRDLIKAAALIVAEIERLDRAAASDPAA